MLIKNDFEVRGDVTVIFLDRKDGSRLETLIDTADLHLVQKFEFTWCANWNKAIQSYYVYGNIPLYVGKRKSIKLHRYLMGDPIGKLVDHKDGNTLDNRRSCNLREATFGQNMQNRTHLDKKNSSGYRGVSWFKPYQKWRAYLNKDRKQIHLGYFDDLLEAAKVASEARKQYFTHSVEVM